MKFDICHPDAQHLVARVDYRDGHGAVDLRFAREGLVEVDTDGYIMVEERVALPRAVANSSDPDVWPSVHRRLIRCGSVEVLDARTGRPYDPLLLAAERAWNEEGRP